MKLHIFLIFFFSLLTFSDQCRAVLASSVDVNFGMTSLNLKTSSFQTTVSSPTAIEANYILKHQAPSLAYVMSFYELLTSQGKFLPYTRFSVGARYYFYGLNGSRLIIDHGAQAQVWKATPFAGFNLGLANISVDEFNASLIEYSPRFGVEIPVAINLIGQAQLIFHSAKSTGTSPTQVSYDGITAMLGLILLNF